MPSKKKRVVQSHHISYDPSWEVSVYQGEHWALTQLGRRKYISKGLLTSLKEFCLRHEGSAIELGAPLKKKKRG